MHVQERVQKLEKEVATLWRVIEDERLWHPSIIQEIKKRSRSARRDHAKGLLRKAEEVLGRHG